MGHTGDSLEIMSHPWFKSINWCNLMARMAKPPYKPKCDDQNWLGNFGEEFTKQDPLRDSVIVGNDKNEVEKIDSHFEGFDFDQTNQVN